jgi:hypothetical protein
LHAVRTLLDKLTAASPAFARAHAEHLAENGELLPYVLLEDFRRWLARHAAADEPEAGAILNVLERCHAHGDADVQNLIGVTILEGLGRDPRIPEERGLRDRLGPSLQAELQRMEEWRP